MNTSSETGVWVTERELIVRGIGGASQKSGRDSGRLRFTPLGADSFAYREGDVSAWLAAENGTSKGKTFTRSAPQAMPAQTPRAMNAPTHAPVAGGAKSAWLAAVDAAIAQGLQRRDAIVQVDETHPGLRLAMIAETRRD